MLSVGVIGNQLYRLNRNAIGIRNRVVNREIRSVSISERIVMISAEKNIKYAKKYCVGVHRYNEESNKAVSNSILGYSTEIGLVQTRHLPLRSNHDNTGILSYQTIVCLH